MTTQQAIDKANAVNLQKALGVPIVPSVMLGRHVSIHPNGLAFDREQPDAERLANDMISSILRAAKESMAANNVIQLKAAELLWIEPDPQSTKGFYRLYLATAP